jgi:hypothetical protein
MPKGQTPALKPEVAQRYRDVVRLKSAGMTFDEIADRVGYASRSGAKEAFDAALRWWGREAVDDMRTIEGERLEQLWRRVFGRILSNPDMPSGEMIQLVNAAVKVSARKASLMGLDAPRQLEVTGAEGGAIVTDVGQILLERLEQLERARGIEP